MKTLLILGGGEMQVPLIKKSIELGLKTVVADFDPAAPGLLFADVKSLASTTDLEAVYNLAVDEKIDGIVTASDYPVRTVAYVCEKMNIAGLSVKNAEVVTNKYLQREIFFNLGLPTPQFKLVSTENDLKACESLSFPLMVKPVDSSASRGVQKISSFSELLEAVKFAATFSKSGYVICEEFIEGREFSVEVLVQNNDPLVIAITEKFIDGECGKYFVEEKHLIPARITSKEYTEIESTVINGIKAIGLNNAAAHAEVKISSIGIVIIEIAGRLGGDYITSDLVPLANGVDMLANVIYIALDQPINLTKTVNYYAGVNFLTPNNYHKTLNRINNSKFNNKIVRKEVKDYKEGVKLKSSLDRFGHFLFQSNNLNEISELMGI